MVTTSVGMAWVAAAVHSFVVAIGIDAAAL
jgi:hypothetical protein